MAWGDWPNPSGGSWRQAEPVKKPRVYDSEEEMLEARYGSEEERNLVTVERTIRKQVPDYEAEILTRHGWEIVE